MRELTRPRRVWHRLERGGRSLILLYHRVASATTDPWRLAVSPPHFAEHLEVLRNAFRPLTVGELVEALQGRRLPPRGVAVTFDDGYADNLLAGLPLLEQYEVPATVYLTAGYIGTTREFWWTEVERLFLEPGPLPERLEARKDGLFWSCDLGSSSAYSAAEAQNHREWVIQSTSDFSSSAFPTERHAAFQSLLAFLEPLEGQIRAAILAELYEAAGIERTTRDSHRMLTGEEAVRLASSAVVDIGAHTMTHARLSTLGLDEQRREIFDSKAHLQTMLDQPVTTFAYPFGQPADYDRRTVDLVRGAGFSCAGAVADVAVSRSSPPFELPRVGVADWTGEEFERRLERWLHRWL